MPQRKDDKNMWEYLVSNGYNGILPMIMAMITRSDKQKLGPQPPQTPPTPGGY